MIKIPKKKFSILLGVLWFSLIIVGEIALLNYGSKPGTPASPPGQWPQNSSLKLNSDRPTLLMFVHPHCPCTRASLGELALLMARTQGKGTAQVIFLKPAKFSQEWSKTGLWHTANEIPGVETYLDENGEEAQQFRVSTSGQTLLYSLQGRLLFQGGITASRGHSGDNTGRSALESLLLQGALEQNKTPVFGCSLTDQRVTFFQKLLNFGKK